MIENLAVGAVCEGVIPRDDAPGQRDVQMSGLGMKQMRAAAVSGGASLLTREHHCLQCWNI